MIVLGKEPVIILCKFLNVITFKLLLSSSNIVFNEDINSGYTASFSTNCIFLFSYYVFLNILKFKIIPKYHILTKLSYVSSLISGAQKPA